jgi:hypothetical protein
MATQFKMADFLIYSFLRLGASVANKPFLSSLSVALMPASKITVIQTKEQNNRQKIQSS